MAITKALNQDSKQYYHLGLDGMGEEEEEDGDVTREEMEEDYEFEGSALGDGQRHLRLRLHADDLRGSLAEELSLAAAAAAAAAAPTATATAEGEDGSQGDQTHPCLRQELEPANKGVHVNRLHECCFEDPSAAAVVTSAPSRDSPQTDEKLGEEDFM